MSINTLKNNNLILNEISDLVNKNNLRIINFTQISDFYNAVPSYIQTVTINLNDVPQIGYLNICFNVVNPSELVVPFSLTVTNNDVEYLNKSPINLPAGTSCGYSFWCDINNLDVSNTVIITFSSTLSSMAFSNVSEIFYGVI